MHYYNTVIFLSILSRTMKPMPRFVTSLFTCTLRWQKPIILFYRRMFAALCSLPSASQLAHSICLGHEPNQGISLHKFLALSTFIIVVVIVALVELQLSEAELNLWICWTLWDSKFCYITNHWEAIGHFSIAFFHCFKTSPRAKLFSWKWVWFTSKWTYRWNAFSYITMVSNEDS